MAKQQQETKVEDAIGEKEVPTAPAGPAVIQIHGRPGFNFQVTPKDPQNFPGFGGDGNVPRGIHGKVILGGFEAKITQWMDQSVKGDLPNDIADGTLVTVVCLNNATKYTCEYNSFKKV
jgi:hypothetical protein